MNELPILDGAEWAVEEGFLTRGDKSNRIYTKDSVINIGEVNKIKEHLLYDPQTSGGLLISIPEHEVNFLLLELHKGGDICSKVVGEVLQETEVAKPGMIVFDYE